MKIMMAISIAGALLAQEGTRGIVPEEVLKARPAAKAGASAPKPQYQPIGSQVVAALRQPGGARQVGITIWRLRTPSAGETGARILVQEDAHTVEWIPERVSSASSLKTGDRVRLSIESPDAGYLYVIDREKYANGERGDPFLIFPTTRTREGDNRVAGGKLIDIPAQDDRPNFFRLKPGRPDQVEEELTVLLTPEPIASIQIGREMLRLSEAQVAKWEKEWGAGRVARFELTGGVGRTWSPSEQQAAASATRVLTQEDPPPQTVYRADVKPGDPLMVKVRLRYGK